MFLFCLVFAVFCARLFICASWSPAGKGLTSWLSFVVSSVSLSLSHWYPGSGVVLDCIDSWSLQPYLLCLILYILVNNLSVTSGQVFLGWASTKQGLMCLAQGCNAVKPVRLEPTALRSWVKHSTTDLPTRYAKILWYSNEMLPISCGNDSSLFSSKSNTCNFFRLPILAGNLWNKQEQAFKKHKTYHEKYVLVFDKFLRLSQY